MKREDRIREKLTEFSSNLKLGQEMARWRGVRARRQHHRKRSRKKETKRERRWPAALLYIEEAHWVCRERKSEKMVK